MRRLRLRRGMSLRQLAEALVRQSTQGPSRALLTRVAYRVRTERVRREMSIRELAKQCRCPPADIEDLEAARLNASFRLLDRITRALNAAGVGVFFRRLNPSELRQARAYLRRKDTGRTPRIRKEAWVNAHAARRADSRPNRINLRQLIRPQPERRKSRG